MFVLGAVNQLKSKHIVANWYVAVRFSSQALQKEKQRQKSEAISMRKMLFDIGGHHSCRSYDMVTVCRLSQLDF